MHLVGDIIHAAWLGVLVMLLRLIPGPAELCYFALKCFSIAVTAPTASGVVNAAYQIDLDQSGWVLLNLYECLLLLKLVLFGGKFMLATIYRFRLTPKLDARGTAAEIDGVRCALRSIIAAECALPLDVLAPVAWLDTLDPTA